MPACRQAGSAGTVGVRSGWDGAWGATWGVTCVATNLAYTVILSFCFCLIYWFTHTSFALNQAPPSQNTEFGPEYSTLPLAQITHGLAPPDWIREDDMDTVVTELIPFQYRIDFGSVEKTRLKVTRDLPYSPV